MLEILNNYPWTRLAVRIIGAIKRQFFHMVTHGFDNSNLSQEIFAIDTWGAVICSLGHGRKHMLTILPTIWKPGLIKTRQHQDVEKIRQLLTVPIRLHGRSSRFMLIADVLFTVIITTTVFVSHFCSSFYLITVRGSVNDRYVVY